VETRREESVKGDKGPSATKHPKRLLGGGQNISSKALWGGSISKKKKRVGGIKKKTPNAGGKIRGSAGGVIPWEEALVKFQERWSI